MLAEVMHQTPARSPRVAAPVTRSFLVPAPPAPPEGAEPDSFHVARGNDGRDAKTLADAVDAWLEWGTKSDLIAFSSRYVECIQPCRAKWCRGANECLPECNGGTWSWKSVYNADRQQWGPWKVA